MAQVQLSDELASQLAEIVKNSNEFSSVDEYVEYVMKQVVVKKQSQASTDQAQASYSKDDEDKIRERLKNLGYLD